MRELTATYLTAANRGGGQRYSVRTCMAPGTYEYLVPGSSCSIFWRAQQKTFTEEATTSEVRIEGPLDARKRWRASLPRMAHAHIQLEAQTPFRSLPGSLVNVLVGQVLSVALNFLQVTQNQIIF